MSWRIEERHVSRMGEVRWLDISGDYRTRHEAERALTRMTGRLAAPPRRIVELAE